MSDDFEAGRLKNFVENWKNLTSDCQILDMVQNCHIELENDKISLINHVIINVGSMNLNPFLSKKKYKN